MYIKISILLSSIGFLFLFTAKIYASDMTNSQYRLETDDFNTSSGTSSVTDANPQSSTIESQKNQSYIIEPGLPANSENPTLRITTSSDSLDFGRLSAGEPILRDMKVSVRNKYVSSYYILGYEDHNLINSSLDQIPDTTCDNGSCSEIVSDQWVVPLTYGFGYSCKSILNNPCLTDIINSNYYKQFANLDKKEQAQYITNGATGDYQAIITFKINITGAQKSDSYTNSVTFLALTSY